MNAQMTWQSVANDILGAAKDRLYRDLAGKPAPGTQERQISDALVTRYLDEIKGKTKVNPQEEREAALRLRKGLAEIEQESSLKGAQGLMPLLLEANQRNTAIQSEAFRDRTGVNTDAAIRLNTANTENQGNLLSRNYGSLKENILDPTRASQEGMFNTSIDTVRQALERESALRSRELGLMESEAQFARDAYQRQNSGFDGFLNKLGSLAGLGLAGYALSRG